MRARNERSCFAGVIHITFIPQGHPLFAIGSITRERDSDKERERENERKKRERRREKKRETKKERIREKNRETKKERMRGTIKKNLFKGRANLGKRRITYAITFYMPLIVFNLLSNI